jgi:serine protease AprX
VRAFRRPARLAAVTAVGTLLTFCAQLGTAAPSGAAAPAPQLVAVSSQVARDLATLPASAPYGVYVTVRGGDAAARAALLVDHGLTVVRDFPSVGIVYGAGTIGAVATLRRAAQVSYLSTSRRLKALDDTSGWAMRVEQVQRVVGNGPYRDGSGHIVDGTGVGVAVVDSGFDGTHPDLASRMVRNTKFKCSTPVLQNTQTMMCFGPVLTVPLADSDVDGGHGTHVAGIVAGDGTSSKGTFHGTAPGASLYGYSVGDGDSIFDFDVAAAYQDILDTNAAGTNTPRIRIATNSWGNAAGTAYDPQDIISVLTRKLVDSGVTVLFAAGNGDSSGDGGNGSDDRLSSTAKDPTPGVITVANYDDAGTGTRNGTLDSSSSRGWKGHPDIYPDISAPGTLITSTCRVYKPICNLGPEPQWAPYYATISGTSMATPAVAGIVALLYQVRPDLTPAQAESLLQDNAYRFGDQSTYEADPQNPGGLISFDKGAGLVDAQAALDSLGVAHDGGESTQGQPAVTVDAPVDGTVSDGTAPLQVSGTASDGYVAPQPFVTQVVATGDGGDLPSPGAADVASLTALETATGIRYTLGVRALGDMGAFNGDYVLRQVIGGNAYATEVGWDGTKVTPSTSTSATFNNAPAGDFAWSLADNTISFTVPFTALGNPGSMSVAYKVVVQSYQGLSVDLMPGGLVVTNVVQPEYGAYTIRRPSVTAAPVTTVTVSVDGGAPTAAAVTGSSPTYSWSTSVPTTGLSEGQHTLSATVLTNGVPGATRTIGFTVVHPVVLASSVAISNPADGAVVDRGLVTVTGTADSNAPAAQVRRVTVQVQSTGYDSGELAADGTTAWSLPFDTASLAAGLYTLTARLYLDSAVAATATRSITVPAPVVLVSCSPRGLSFWQEQYNGSKKAVFTTSEADALASKAAALSNGYFTKAALTNVLYAKGKLPAETSAARQYAPLLLNLAAGQLSATMSSSLGLSGKETLDPGVYDTATVGGTVSAATGWIRAQFSTGDLAKAEQTAININTRTGLGC